MTRAEFQRHMKFNLDDHLFQVKVQLKDSEEIPILLDLAEDINKILEITLGRLQNLYSSKFEHHVYISFEQIETGFFGITTGNFLLHSKTHEPEVNCRLIARSALELLKSVLRSDKALKLDDSFKIKSKNFNLIFSNSN